MKKTIFAGLFLIFTLIGCKTISVTNAQIEDLISLDYPIVYEGPNSNNHGGVYIRVKNISKQTISEVSFVYGNSNLRAQGLIRPNQVVEFNWSGESGGGIVREIEVQFSFQDGGRRRYFDQTQSQHMLARDNYFQGQTQTEIQVAIQRDEPVGDPTVYIEKRWEDIANNNYPFSESYRPTDGMFPPGNGNHRISPYGRLDGDRYWFNLTSEVYIRSDTDGFFILYDENGNERTAAASSVYFEGGGFNNIFRIYRLQDNNDFDPGRKYRVYIRVRSGGPEYRDHDYIYLDDIDGLLTYNEAQTVDRQARQEAERILQQNRSMEIEARYREAIASRNVDTIMQFLQSDAMSPLQSDRRTELRVAGYHEAAKILTRNNNILLGDFTTSWQRYFSSRNQNAFDSNVVYYLFSIRPTQLIDGTFVVRLGSNAEDSILLLDIPLQITRQWGVDYSQLFGVLMRYEGLIPMQLPNGRTTGIPSFVVLYHYRGN